jgi:hypothetical protein
MPLDLKKYKHDPSKVTAPVIVPTKRPVAAAAQFLPSSESDDADFGIRRGGAASTAYDVFGGSFPTLSTGAQTPTLLVRESPQQRNGKQAARSGWESQGNVMMELVDTEEESDDARSAPETVSVITETPRTTAEASSRHGKRLQATHLGGKGSHRPPAQIPPSSFLSPVVVSSQGDSSTNLFKDFAFTSAPTSQSQSKDSSLSLSALVAKNKLRRESAANSPLVSPGVVLIDDDEELAPTTRKPTKRRIESDEEYASDGKKSSNKGLSRGSSKGPPAKPNNKRNRRVDESDDDAGQNATDEESDNSGDSGDSDNGSEYKEDPEESLDLLIARCESVSQQLQSTLAADAEAAEKEGGRKQPRVLGEGLQLKSYQLVGVAWLNILHQLKLSGILADEMVPISFLFYL